MGTHELSLSPEVIHAILETMPAGVFTVDPQGIITSWNSSAERITGYTRDEVIGQYCGILEGDACLGVDCQGGIVQCGLFKKGEVRNLECAIRTKDGRVVYVLKNASVLRDAEGELIGGVENLIDITHLKEVEERLATLRAQVKDIYAFHSIVGKNHQMVALYDLIQKAASSDVTALIEGESGTGKELIANAIHHCSRRRDGPLVKVSCSALAESLLESELFGHAKGAFTGAAYTKIGRFEAADGGTLFLDEVSEISPYIQVKLLRVLENHTFERVGESQPRQVDVRIIAASNQDLGSLVQQGLLRQDLYYRLKVFSMRVPPLRQRKDDVPLLVDHFVRCFNQKMRKGIRGVSPQAMQVLLKYSWPGNVRELEHALEHAFVVVSGDEIGVEHLPAELTRELVLPRASAVLHGDNHEAMELKAALLYSRGHRSRAAQMLGVSRVTLWKRMKKYGITYSSMS